MYIYLYIYDQILLHFVYMHNIHSVANVLNTWGGNVNIVVQAGVNVAHYCNADTTGNIGTNSNNSMDMQIHTVNHCNSSYISTTLPQLVKSVLNIDINTMIWMLLHAISPNPISSINSKSQSDIEFVLSHREFVTSLVNMNDKDNDTNTVFPSKLIEIFNKLIIDFNNVESYSYIVQTIISTNSNGNSNGCDSNSNSKKEQGRKIPKAERKRMKKQNQLPISTTSATTTTATGNTGETMKKTDSVNSQEIFGIVMKLEKRKNNIKLIIETPVDVCHSIYDILTHFVNMK